MRHKENFRPYISVAFVLTFAILGTFQVYLLREPARIERDLASEHLAAEKAGQALYAENCMACHGRNGEGGVGSPLNERNFLEMTVDEILFSIVRTGVPGTIMPAWSQAFGGPFTDEQVSQIVTFMRAWEASAPVIEPIVEAPDPVRGAAIYAGTCTVCHGEDGQGTGIAPALNDPERLQKLDDAWYRGTIMRGRPAKGMPTWGTVLSPLQINDVVALLAAWREGQTVAANIPLTTLVTNALFAIREFDRPDAVFYLNAALALTDGAQTQEVETIITLVEENHLFEAETQLIALLPPEEMGRASYSSNCAPCHGDDGSGGMGPNLRTNAFVGSKSDQELVDFILAGRQGTAMDGFEGILGNEEISNIITLMRNWQSLEEAQPGG
jgi:cytochrome c oxidase cbb3-type subunit III